MDACLPSRIDILQLTIANGKDASGIRNVLKRYLETAEDCLNQLERSSQQNNILSWSHALREMKAASTVVTAKRLASLCVEAEQITAFPNPQTMAVVYHLYKELGILREEIQHLVTEAPSEAAIRLLRMPEPTDTHPSTSREFRSDDLSA